MPTCLYTVRLRCVHHHQGFKVNWYIAELSPQPQCTHLESIMGCALLSTKSNVSDRPPPFQCCAFILESWELRGLLSKALLGCGGNMDAQLRLLYTSVGARGRKWTSFGNKSAGGCLDMERGWRALASRMHHGRLQVLIRRREVMNRMFMVLWGVDILGLVDVR